MTGTGPVLIADDDEDIRELVVFKLEQSGYEVLAVADGSAALAAIRERRPILAILDIMMPGMSGLDVLHEIRADTTLDALRVILLTARSRDLDVDAGYSGLLHRRRRLRHQTVQPTRADAPRGVPALAAALT